jgi:hypothetical protein
MMKQVIMSFSPVPTFVAPETPGPYTNEELGLMWLDWVVELSADSIRNYELVLMVKPNLTLPDSVNAWAKVTRFPENQGITGWPQGPNACFKQINWFYYHGKLKGPFLWLEADCIPVVPDWLDLIADEYQRGGKPFMGAIVEPDSHVARIGRVPRHMTGNAVYPEHPYKLAPRIMEATHTCWDVLAAPQILPQCHPTTLIQHDWRRPEIKDRQELSKILLPNTALFHSDKYGAIRKILGKREEPAPRPVDMPITEYAEKRRAPIAGLAECHSLDIGISAAEIYIGPAVGDPPSPIQPLGLVSVDDLLEQIKIRAADPILRKQIAKYLVLNNVVNHGHCTQYGKPFGGKKGAKYKPPAARGKEPPVLSDKEFKDRIQKKSPENAAASVTD